MAQLLKLRDYQSSAIDAVDAEWAKGIKRTALVLATGTGKTVIFSHVARRFLETADKGEGVLILVHRDELADQAANKLRDVVAGMQVGIVKAGRNDVNARVIIGSVQTLRNSARLEQLRRIGLVIVDECHHAAAASYVKIMTELGCYDDASPVVSLGVTATLSRNDGKGLGEVWQTIAGEPYDILDGIADGWLTDVRGHLVTVDGLTLSDLSMSRGDFKVGSLTEALETSDARRFVIESYTEHARDMPGVVFVPSVKSAFDFTEAFSDAGYSVAAVWGDMDHEDRKLALKRFREGDTQLLVNCMVLTEGFDAPRAQCAVIARPTTSPTLYTQMVGRVLRPFPGKGAALVLDVVGASRDHRLATLADLSTGRITEITEGETLREAAERERKRTGSQLAGYTMGWDEVDLFHRSRAIWLQTYGGTWFIGVGNALVFIWPTGDAYSVGIRPRFISGGRWIREGVSLDAAMAWGEAEADRYAEAWQNKIDKSFGTTRSASWRRSPASRKAMDRALRIGITLDQLSGDLRAGALSDMIDRHEASAKLDTKKG
jgi:superfamily II DNA or RNA helicase